jgi:hypothetical protein
MASVALPNQTHHLRADRFAPIPTGRRVRAAVDLRIGVFARGMVSGAYV